MSPEEPWEIAESSAGCELCASGRLVEAMGPAGRIASLVGPHLPVTRGHRPSRHEPLRPSLGGLHPGEHQERRTVPDVLGVSGYDDLARYPADPLRRATGELHGQGSACHRPPAPRSCPRDPKDLHDHSGGRVPGRRSTTILIPSDIGPRARTASSVPRLKQNHSPMVRGPSFETHGRMKTRARPGASWAPTPGKPRSKPPNPCGSIIVGARHLSLHRSRFQAAPAGPGLLTVQRRRTSARPTQTRSHRRGLQEHQRRATSMISPTSPPPRV